MNSPSSLLPEHPVVGLLTEVLAKRRAFLAGLGRFFRPHHGETTIADPSR